MNIFNKLYQAFLRRKTALGIYLFPNNYYIYKKNLFSHHRLSFSQEGEDMVLAGLFYLKNTRGFYVDVGAHHPQKLSNTYRFYLDGWNGINIDPLPEGIKVFNDIRPRDINLEYAISDDERELTYYEFNQPAINTFSGELAKKRDGYTSWKLLGKRKIKTHRLMDILDEYLPEGKRIDFMNIDVEGWDLQVLKSNDWIKYRPDVIIIISNIRAINVGLKKAGASPVVDYLEQQGYELFTKTINTLIFSRKN